MRFTEQVCFDSHFMLIKVAQRNLTVAVFAFGTVFVKHRPI